MVTEEFRDAAAVVDAGSARLSIRARDRSVGEDGENPPFARTLYIDDVTLISTIPAPTFDPGAQTFTADELVVTLNGPDGSTLYVTTDGSEPSESSMAMLPGETLTITETTTVSVIAVIDGESSSVRSATYTRAEEEEEEAPVDEAPEEEDEGPSGNNRSGASTSLLFALAALMLALRPRAARSLTLKK